MKRFIIRCLLFVIPFATLVLTEICVLPIDVFSFRVWESLKIDTLKEMLPGYFYPLEHVVKTEEGDLGHHTVYAIKKHVEWYTDRFGYRNRDDVPDPDVVVIGDSNTVGAGLTQQDVLAEVLGRYTGVQAYSFAPASVNAYLRERRFLRRPPRVVVVATIEWDIPLLRPLKTELASPSEVEKKFLDLRGAIKEARPVQRVAVPVDRVFKANMLQFCRASLRRAVMAIPARFDNRPPEKRQLSRMHFIIGDPANKDMAPAQLARSVEVITSYNNLFKGMGIRFVFLPIPNKENIYYDLLPSKKKPVFVNRLTETLERAGVEVVDLQKSFDEIYREKGPILYQIDDSHWSGEGVKIAARLLADLMSREKGESRDGSASP